MTNFARRVIQDFGTAAGFYLNATNEKWKKHYNMYAPITFISHYLSSSSETHTLLNREKYITEELPGLISASDLPIDTSNASVFGHSMGGHGALTLYLNHPGLYKSASAFAPICNPVNAPWGKKAFAGPNGNDGYLAGGVEEGKKYDATELIAKKKGDKVDLLIDTGTGDNLYVPLTIPAVCKQFKGRCDFMLIVAFFGYAATKQDSSYRRTSRRPSKKLVWRSLSL